MTTGANQVGRASRRCAFASLASGVPASPCRRRPIPSTVAHLSGWQSKTLLAVCLARLMGGAEITTVNRAELDRLKALFPFRRTAPEIKSREKLYMPLEQSMFGKF